MGQLLAKGHDIDILFKKLTKYDKNGGFKMEPPKSIWYMVLCDPAKDRMSRGGEPLAIRLLMYLFGGGIADDKERAALRDALGDARTFKTGEKEGKAIDFNGKFVDPGDIELPPVVHA